MQIRPSKILEGYNLNILYPEDKEYQILNPLFKVYGLAVTRKMQKLFNFLRYVSFKIRFHMFLVLFHHQIQFSLISKLCFLPRKMFF